MAKGNEARVLSKVYWFSGRQVVDREERTERELGRKKLMMRLPALRDQLRDASGDQIEAIFVAWERAAAYQDRIRTRTITPAELAAYYEELSEILEESAKRYFSSATQ
ncbi:hypothetical protein QTL95_17545 [Rhizobium sp. S152]|uniref:hypothetical protein n=1 Tax=Rhizobium sp. S152 TaxID=3055038 RepID=UPI0025A969F3|nr:hypothetical protein [Rhizobium sp. S152]MDM9627706.1 hypothetical protein [Rhizobium sp. S152]